MFCACAIKPSCDREIVESAHFFSLITLASCTCTCSESTIAGKQWIALENMVSQFDCLCVINELPIPHSHPLERASLTVIALSIPSQTATSELWPNCIECHCLTVAASPPRAAMAREKTTGQAAGLVQTINQG